MIGSIRHKGLHALYHHQERKGVMQSQLKRIGWILELLETAITADDMDLPGFRLHPLKGNLKGFHAVTVKNNWRVIFRFENGVANDIDLVDYH